MRKPFLISCAVVLLACGNANAVESPADQQLQTAWRQIAADSDHKATLADFENYIRLAGPHLAETQQRLNAIRNQCEHTTVFLPFCNNATYSMLLDQISSEQVRKSGAEKFVADTHAKREAAERQRNEDAAKARFAADIAGKTQALTSNGYKLITVREFVVDGETLAESSGRVLIKGAFISENPRSEYLIVGDFNSPNQVPVLSEDADRETRMLLATCRDNQFGPYGHYHGCNVVYLAGIVSKCSLSVLGQHIRDQPCLEVTAGFRAERTD